MNAPARNRAPQRSRSGGGRSRSGGQRPRNSQPQRTTRTSELEAALDAAALIPVEPTDFAGLGVSESVVRRLADNGITTPTEVQTRTIPDALAGRDILGRAQTGSGKTLAFGIPLVAALAQQRVSTSPHHPRALVLAPTRELAQQVAESIDTVARAHGLSVLAIYGGAAMNQQTRALDRGVDIVVATPGRLEDHMRRGACDLSRVAVFVLDEADHMADMGFLPVVTAIMATVPDSAQRLMFSATLDRGVERLATAQLRQPAVHAASASAQAATTMEHRAFTVQSDEKLLVAAKVAARNGRTLFFVRTKHGANRLAKQLGQHGLSTEAIHGNRSQSQRQKALAEFAAGRRPILVATDVAARGIHVDGVDLVVHYDPPADHKDYLHRSGRTARAGRDGLVLSLLLPHENGPHRRMHQNTASDHHPVAVRPDSPQVHELAAGGTPLQVEPAPVGRPESPRSGGGQPRRGSGRARTGSSGKGRPPTHGKRNPRHSEGRPANRRSGAR